jgi:hypothetical protein
VNFFTQLDNAYGEKREDVEGRPWKASKKTK